MPKLKQSLDPAKQRLYSALAARSMEGLGRESSASGLGARYMTAAAPELRQAPISAYDPYKMLGAGLGEYEEGERLAQVYDLLIRKYRIAEEERFRRLAAAGIGAGGAILAGGVTR